MEKSAIQRLWMFSRRRREMIDLGQQLPAETIPAIKAGGKAVVGAWPSVLNWFMLDCADHFGMFQDGRIWEEAGGWAAAPDEAIAALQSYRDMTLPIYRRLLEAEHLASPEDFQGIEYGLGFPVGYVRILRDIWLRRHG